jgi:hypothetical protein
MGKAVSFRITCTECDTQTYIRRRDLDDSPWTALAPYKGGGICPDCSPAATHDSADAETDTGVQFEALNNIGEVGASNLRDAGIVTEEDVRHASDEEILAVPAVGEAGLSSIRRKIR